MRIFLCILTFMSCGFAISQPYQFFSKLDRLREEPITLYQTSDSAGYAFQSARTKLHFTLEDSLVTTIKELDLKGKYKFISRTESQLMKYSYFDNGKLQSVEFWENDEERMETDNTFDPVHTAYFEYDELGRLLAFTAYGTLKKERTILDSNYFICKVNYSYNDTSSQVKQIKYTDKKGNLLESPVAVIDFIYDGKSRISELNFTGNGNEVLYGNCKTVKYSYKNKKKRIFNQTSVTYEVLTQYDENNKKCRDKLHLMSFSTPRIKNFNHIINFLKPGEWTSVSNFQFQFEMQPTEVVSFPFK